MPSRNIIVIGGGPAGVFAAIEAKRRDPAADVALLSEEPVEPYERPPLSKAVLLGKAMAADALIAGPKLLAGHGVRLLSDARCTMIDRDAAHVVTASGQRFAYDALVIATGSLVRQIPLLPLGMRRVHYLRTEAHARALAAELRTARHLVVVGGGLIGLEVAASAAELSLNVTVIEMLPRILARVCDEGTSARVHDAHRRHGVDIRLGSALAQAQVQADGPIALATASGETFIADVVVIGAGAVPDDRLAAAAGLATDSGIVVDARCTTSDPKIFAAGDVVRFPGPHGLVRREDWRHAQEQGAVAGRNAAGAGEEYRSVPSFWSEQFDLYIQGVGTPPLRGGATVRRAGPGISEIVFAMDEDAHVCYALGINAMRDIATTRRLIERRIAIDPAALADPTKPLTSFLKAKPTS